MDIYYQTVSMATLEKISFHPSRLSISDSTVCRERDRRKETVVAMPQILWSNNTPWREANLWAYEQRSKGVDPKTTLAAIGHLHAYSKWLESQSINWWHFPAREADRCLIMFRGSLIAARDNCELAPSTTTQRMSAVVRFYRWLTANRLLSTNWPMWTDKQVGVRLLDEFGFTRTMMVTSTSLAIPNRKVTGDKLEDGLLPVSIKAVQQIIDFSLKHGSYEIYLMLKLGFGTGMRIGTLCDLRISTIQRAVADTAFPGFNKLAIGPGAHPRVHTKFGVTGQAWISDEDLQLLRDYIFSTRRLMRQSKATAADRDAVFLTRNGNTFGKGDGNASRGISVQLGRLRKAGIAHGMNVFRNFRFHQTRCTFATELARTALSHGTASMAIQLVRQALLHKSEKTTLTYIRFIEKTAVMSEVANAFTRDFLGLAGSEALEK
ncbi:Integrase/recombinase [Pseudomonas coronafaciens pv. atropurpurea]|nr:Integrase/recombinase [Pseudomonas coronafaciens pv. atropurpurea]